MGIGFSEIMGRTRVCIDCGIFLISIPIQIIAIIASDGQDMVDYVGCWSMTGCIQKLKVFQPGIESSSSRSLATGLNTHCKFTSVYHMVPRTHVFLECN